MPRPRKWRKVEFIPDIREFMPFGAANSDTEANVLKIEELEAVRLKDVEELDQEQCAKKMEVSRQTFQRILNSGRKKMADSLVSGKGIRIEGGNFTRNVCSVRCLDCGSNWDESYENYQELIKDEYKCPNCGSIKVVCSSDRGGGFCRGNCRRFGRGRT